MTTSSAPTPRPALPMHPYADRYSVHATMPEQGVPLSLIHISEPTRPY